jgi:putative endonuclease
LLNMACHVEGKARTWVVYMIRCRSGKLYTGVTTDLERRWREHNGGVQGARYTRADPPQAIVYSEFQPDRSHACKREAAIKKLPRSAKLALVSGYSKES